LLEFQEYPIKHLQPQLLLPSRELHPLWIVHTWQVELVSLAQRLLLLYQPPF
jgi:hypothetical protein